MIAFSRNNNSRLISRKNNSDGEIRFGGNSIEHAKKLEKSKKLSKSKKSKSEKSAKSKKPSKSRNSPNFDAKKIDHAF